MPIACSRLPKKILSSSGELNTCKTKCKRGKLNRNSHYSWNTFFFARSIGVLMPLVRRRAQNLRITDHFTNLRLHPPDYQINYVNIKDLCHQCGRFGAEIAHSSLAKRSQLWEAISGGCICRLQLMENYRNNDVKCKI